MFVDRKVALRETAEEDLVKSRQVLERCNACAQRIDPEQSLADTCRIIESFAQDLSNFV